MYNGRLSAETPRLVNFLHYLSSGYLADSGRLFRTRNDEELSIVRKFCWALGPKGVHFLQPLAKRLAETLVARITRGAKLGLYSLWAKKRYASGSGLDGPAFPDDPYVEIEQARCIGKAGDKLAFHGDWVLVDLLIKALAEGNYVSLMGNAS